MKGQRTDAVRRLIATIAERLARQSAKDGVEETLRRLGEHDVGDSTGCQVEAKSLPACRLLGGMIGEIAARDSELAEAVETAVDALCWRQNQNYSDQVMGQTGFMENYAYAELIGSTGAVAGDDFRLGLMILGRNLHYHDHFHPAPELYWLLTGPTDWKAGAGGFTSRIAGETVWHPPFRVHATRTGDASLLAVWAWTRDVSEPARLVGG